METPTYTPYMPRKVQEANALALSGTTGGALTKTGQIVGGDYSSEPAILSTTNGQKTAGQLTQDIRNESNLLTTRTSGVAQRQASDKAAKNELLPPELQAELDANQTEEDKIRKETDKSNEDLIKAYESSAVANTASTQALVRSLTSNYESARAELSKINNIQSRSVKTSNMRTGLSRYAPEASARALATMEREGLSKLTELDGLYVTKVAEAEEALNEKNFTLAKEKAGEISAIKKSALAELTERTKKAKELKDELMKKAIQAPRDTAVADLITEGVTDPVELLNRLNQGGGGYTAKEVKDALDSLYPQGSGVVAEYNFYKRDAQSRGIVPMSFDEYQTQDANRKVSIAQAAINSGGLTPQQTTNFLRISDKFQADEIMKAANKGKTAVTIADQVIANPKNAGNQLAILYTLVKSLDPDSAVREGELALAQQTQSYLGKFKNSLDRLAEGRLITDSSAKELATATKNLANTWYEAGQRREKQYKSQATTAGVGTAFNDYLGGYERPYGDEAIETQVEAKKAVDDYILANPADAENIAKLYDVPGTTDEDISEWIELNRKQK